LKKKISCSPRDGESEFLGGAGQGSTNVIEPKRRLVDGWWLTPKREDMQAWDWPEKDGKAVKD